MAERRRPEILVVEDNPADVHLVREILKEAAFEVVLTVAENGSLALSQLRDGRSTPDLVLTDLQMPRMDGIELVEWIRREFSSLPVVLMTAYGNEDVALRALQKGAASYVPKKHLQHSLVHTLERILEVVTAEQENHQLRRCLVESEHRFVLENDLTLIPPIVHQLGEGYARMMQCDENERIRLAIALSEALANAIFHGNLELDTNLREKANGGWLSLVEERRRTAPYHRRRVGLTARVSRTGAVYTVRDEGPGFEPSSLPDPRDSSNVAKIGGRGLFLIRLFMDEVIYNETGNEITMIRNAVQ